MHIKFEKQFLVHDVRPNGDFFFPDKNMFCSVP